MLRLVPDAGDLLERAVAIFLMAGEEWGVPLVNMMSRAEELGAVAGTLTILERYFRRSPSRDPEVHHRGEVRYNQRTGPVVILDGRRI